MLGSEKEKAMRICAVWFPNMEKAVKAINEADCADLLLHMVSHVPPGTATFGIWCVFKGRPEALEGAEWDDYPII